MKDFLLAALPWVLVALPAAILAANHGLQQQTDKQRSTRIATGRCPGFAAGRCAEWLRIVGKPCPGVRHWAFVGHGAGYLVQGKSAL